MISSMYASAIRQPSTMWARASRLAELVLRPPADHVALVLDEQPERARAAGASAGRPSTRASMMTLNESCSGEYWKSWLRTTWGSPSLLTSIRIRMLAVGLVVDVGHARDDRSPLTSSASFLSGAALGELVGDLGEDDLRAAVLLLLDLVLGPDDDPCRGRSGTPRGCPSGRRWCRRWGSRGRG